MRRLWPTLIALLGLTLLAAPQASAAVATSIENRASGSPSGSNNLVGTETRLSEEAVGENVRLAYELASDDAVAARGTTTALSEIRYTQAGEKFIRYESGHPGFSKITPSGGTKVNTYAAPASEGVVPLGGRASRYNLPEPQIPRPVVKILEPPAGTPIISPRPVQGGPGNEVLFPWGF